MTRTWKRVCIGAVWACLAGATVTGVASAVGVEPSPPPLPVGAQIQDLGQGAVPPPAAGGVLPPEVSDSFNAQFSTTAELDRLEKQAITDVEHMTLSVGAVAVDQSALINRIMTARQQLEFTQNLRGSSLTTGQEMSGLALAAADALELAAGQAARLQPSPSELADALNQQILLYHQDPNANPSQTGGTTPEAYYARPDVVSGFRDGLTQQAFNQTLTAAATNQSAKQDALRTWLTARFPAANIVVEGVPGIVSGGDLAPYIIAI